MNKRIEINLIDPEFVTKTNFYDDLRKVGLCKNHPEIHSCDCTNILNKFKNKKISNKDMENAIDTIIAYFAQRNYYKMVVDIQERDRALAPAKEMTLDEIENKLGYKIKIVNKEVENDN